MRTGVLVIPFQQTEHFFKTFIDSLIKEEITEDVVQTIVEDNLETYDDDNTETTLENNKEYKFIIILNNELLVIHSAEVVSFRK